MGSTRARARLVIYVCWTLSQLPRMQPFPWEFFFFLLLLLLLPPTGFFCTLDHVFLLTADRENSKRTFTFRRGAKLVAV